MFVLKHGGGYAVPEHIALHNALELWVGFYNGDPDCLDCVRAFKDLRDQIERRSEEKGYYSLEWPTPGVEWSGGAVGVSGTRCAEEILLTCRSGHTVGRGCYESVVDVLKDCHSRGFWGKKITKKVWRAASERLFP